MVIIKIKMVKIDTFSPKIDKLSENIIYCLSINSRLTVTELSYLLRVSRKKVETRVKKLYSERYIKPLLIYNYPDLLKATILIKLSAFDQRIIDFVKQLNPLIKLKETLGLYDLSLLIIAQEEKELQKVLFLINKQFHQQIQNLDILRHQYEDTLGYKSFCHNPNLLAKYKPLKLNLKYFPTPLEKMVIDILKSQPNLSYRQLMTKTELNYKVIKKVIFNLIEKRIIRFSANPNYNLLNLEFHNLLVKINLAGMKEFERNILIHPRIHWIKKSTGRWDYVLSICSRDISEFIDIVREIRTKNKDLLFENSALISKIDVMRQS